MPELKELTILDNEDLYYPNDVKYVYSQKPFKPLKFHPNDKYIYEIKKLSSEETVYCNELFLDRINTWLGFSSLDKVADSLVAYAIDNSYPLIPRVEYKELYDLLNEKYGKNIEIDKIERLR